MKVEFLLTNPLLVSHFGPVVQALLKRGVDAALVAPDPSARRMLFDREYKARLFGACAGSARAAGVPFRSSADPDADVAITVLGSNVLHLYRHTKLKFRYGVGFYKRGGHYNAAMTQGFDGLLAHGPFEQELFARWFAANRIRIMGIPRHDAFFRAPPSKTEARRALAVSEDESRRVLAYFPTWDEHSSLESFAVSASTLARSHLLLVKPHALSELGTQARHLLQRLQAQGARLLSADTAFAQVVAASDLVITDAKSGSTPEAALLGSTTALVSITALPIEDFHTELLEAGPCVRDPRALVGAVESSLLHDEFVARRRALKTRLFSDNQGHAAADAAEAILQLSRLPKLSSKPSRMEQVVPAIYRVARGRAVTRSARFPQLAKATPVPERAAHAAAPTRARALPEVSVVVPLHDRVDYVEQALASVLEQSYDDLEVIVVDDGSTDGSYERVAALRDPRIVCRRQSSTGLPATSRNVAIQLAKGEYIAFLDGDDLWLPGKLARQVEALDARPDLGMVYGWAMLFDGTGDLELCGPKTATMPETIFEALLLDRCFPSLGTVVVRRTVLERVGLFDEDPSYSTGDDFDLFLRIAHGHPALFIPEVVTRRRIHPGSSSCNEREVVRGLRRIIEQSCRRLEVDPLLRDRALARADLEEFRAGMLSEISAREARECLDRALRLDPENHSARLSRVLVDAGLLEPMRFAYRKRRYATRIRDGINLGLGRLGPR